MKTSHGRPFVWAIIVLGILATAVGALSVWVAGKVAFGQPATGKVVEFHRTGSSSRNVSIVGEVEVTLPGSPTFRDEVDDAMGSLDWSVGGNVPLRCTHFYADHWSCSADSGLSRFLFPLLILVAGLGMGWWSARELRDRRSPA
jgi:hypothetical protein